MKSDKKSKKRDKEQDGKGSEHKKKRSTE